MEKLSEQVPGSTITPLTSTQHPRRTAQAGISTTMMDRVQAVIRSTAGTTITSIKTGTPIATTTTEAAVDITTTGATAAASKTIGGDDTETAHRFQKRLCRFFELCSGCLYRNKPLWTLNNLGFGATFVFLQIFLNFYPHIFGILFRFFLQEI